MSDDKFNVAEDRQINQADIMISLFDQADKYFKYAQGYGNAKARRDRKAVMNERLFGKLELEVRADPSEFGLEEVKESAIKAVVRNQDEYKNAVATYYDLVNETAAFKAGMLAMEQRSYMLTNIVTNLATGVRSVPKVILDDHKVQKVSGNDMERSQLDHLKKKKGER